MKTTKRKSKTTETTPAAEAGAPAGGVPQDASSGRVIALSSHCTIKDAAALKQELCKVAQATDEVVVDIGAVERVDTTTIQLLSAFVRDRQRRAQKVTWCGVSQAWDEEIGRAHV